jgi:signal peptidase II
MSEEAPVTPRRADGVVLLLVAALLTVADQVTKALVVANLEVGQRVSVIGDLVQIWHAQNRGAAFSLLQGETLLFLAVSLLALGMVVYFHRSFRGRSTWLHVLLGVVLAGTLGNFIDRLRQGYVTDFVSVGFGDLRFPAFNVADSSLTIGIGILVIYLFLTDPDRREARA